MIGSLLRERDDLRVENLRLQVELERYKRCYYGPRADGSQTVAMWHRCCYSLPKGWSAGRSILTMFRRIQNQKKICGG